MNLNIKNINNYYKAFFNKYRNNYILKKIKYFKIFLLLIKQIIKLNFNYKIIQICNRIQDLQSDCILLFLTFKLFINFLF